MKVGIPGVNAYPLQWPEGWPRSKYRSHAPYKVELGQARDELLAGVRLLGAREAVISSNLQLRRDGLPYADAREPLDPGIAVYWTTGKGEPKVMACDRWQRIRENVRAVGLAIEGLRAIQRAGATQILDRAFLGFAALPATAGQSVAAKSWRELLGLPGEFTRDQLDARFRDLAKTAHPDVAGGSTVAMAELSLARMQALAHLGTSTP